MTVCPAQELLDLREGLVEAMVGLVDNSGWRVQQFQRRLPSVSESSSLDLEELSRIHDEVSVPAFRQQLD